MGLEVLFLIVLFLVFLWFKQKTHVSIPAQNEKSFEEEQYYREAENLLVDMRATEIATKINTYRELFQLGGRIDKAKDKLDNIDYSTNEAQFDEQNKKLLALESAYFDAKNKIWKYYFNGDIKPDLPLCVLRKIGKVLSVREYNNILYKYKPLYFQEITIEECSDMDELKEDALGYLVDDMGDLIELRGIFESSISGKQEKYNEYVESHNHLIKYFDQGYLDYFDEASES